MFGKNFKLRTFFPPTVFVVFWEARNNYDFIFFSNEIERKKNLQNLPELSNRYFHFGFDIFRLDTDKIFRREKNENL